MITVISTAYASASERACRASVEEQIVPGVEDCARHDVRHVYIDASTQRPPKCAAENLWIEARAARPTDIIALVDGDDTLASKSALAHIARIYEDPNVWLTYGSFAYQDGRPGFAAPYREGENVRTAPFRATHLKTFRASLFHHLTIDDFQHTVPSPAHAEYGALTWIEHARDMYTMLPLLELAGLDRSRFVPEVLYLYNLKDSFEFSATPAELRTEQAAVRECRARTPKKRLVSL